MNYNNLKYMADIETPDEHYGYVSDQTFIPLDPNNRDYDEIQVWISEGNEIDPSYTEEELSVFENTEIQKTYLSMVQEGEILNQSNQTRINFDGPVLITEATANEVWMQDLYDDGVVLKPPGSQRQLLKIYNETVDNYLIERAGEAGSWKWIITLLVPDTILSVSVYSGEVFLYDLNFGLCWRGMCVITEDTPTEEPLFFKFNCDGAITNIIEVEENTDDVIRYDPDYD